MLTNSTFQRVEICHPQNYSHIYIYRKDDNLIIINNYMGVRGCDRSDAESYRSLAVRGDRSCLIIPRSSANRCVQSESVMCTAKILPKATIRNTDKNKAPKFFSKGQFLFFQQGPILFSHRSMYKQQQQQQRKCPPPAPLTNRRNMLYMLFLRSTIITKKDITTNIAQVGTNAGKYQNM